MLPLSVDFMLFSRYNHAITLKVLLGEVDGITVAEALYALADNGVV